MSEETKTAARPVEVDPRGFVRRGAFPQDWRARSVRTERRQERDITVAPVVTSKRELIDGPSRVDAGNRRLRRRPQFEASWFRHSVLAPRVSVVAGVPGI